MPKMNFLFQFSNRNNILIKSNKVYTGRFLRSNLFHQYLQLLFITEVYIFIENLKNCPDKNAQNGKWKR